MKLKYWIFSIVVVCIVALLALLAGKKVFWLFEQPLAIAVVGPINEPNGQAMVQGVELYLKKINREGGINGKRIVLKKFDDKNTQAIAKEEAKKIVDSEVLAVIGHYSSDPTKMAAPVYKDNIPAITGTATADEITQDNDWYFRIIFNNSSQGAVVANYVRKIFGSKKAYLFFEEDAYGKTLAEAFTKTADRIQLEVLPWRFQKNDNEDFEDFNAELEKMIDSLVGEEEEKCALFLATHSEEAIKVITQLPSSLNCQIIGADALASSHFMQTFSGDPKAKNEGYPSYPTYYTNGIFTVSSFLLNIAGKRGQNFKQEFLELFSGQKNKIVTAAMYYDAAMVAVDAIQKTLTQEQKFEEAESEAESLIDEKVAQILQNSTKAESAPENSKQKPSQLVRQRRQLIQYNLRHLSKLENAVEGVTGNIYFNKQGDVIKSVPIGFYKKGNLIAAFEQYQPIAKLNRKELLSKILANEIIQVPDRFMHRTHLVYVGVDFNDIQELDVKKSTYTADFYLWFRAKPAAHHYNIECIDFINIFDPKENKLGKSLLGEESHCDQEPQLKQEKFLLSTKKTKSYRLKRKFKVHFNFKDYPLDKQTLNIRFWHPKLTTEQLIYVVDFAAMDLRDLKTHQIAQKLKKEGRFSISGWKIKEVSFFQNSQKNDSTFGDPDLLNAQQRLEYSQFNVEIEIERYVLSFILKNLLPVLFVIGLGYAVYFTNVFSIKMSLSINVILATSLFHLKLATSELAGVEYQVLIEELFYLVYMMGIFGVVTSLIYYAKNDKLEKIEKTLELEKAKKDKELTEIKEDEKIRMIEEQIARERQMVDHIDWWGRITYPVVLLFFFMTVLYRYYF